MEHEKQVFKEKIISLLSEDEVHQSFLLQQIEEISAPEITNYFYSNLIDLFVHLSVDEDEAKHHWEEIFIHYDQICSELERDVGLRLAIYDYFINLNKSIENPLLVEIRMFNEAKHYAMFDSLTGLFNRRYFDINLAKELQRARRYKKALSIFLLDIDDFKTINDSKGHLFGDEVLKKFAAFLNEMSREEDIVCRFGGEEFIIILPETTAKKALHYSDRIRKALKQNTFFTHNKVTFSGGIAQYPYAGKSVPQLIANADKSVYEAKSKGKDKIIISNKEKRRAFRYPKTWHVGLQPLVEDQQRSDNLVSCVTQNISLDGLSLEVGEDHTIGDRILLTIELPEKDKIVVVGEVVWRGKNEDDLSRYGIEYIDLSPQQLSHMEYLLSNEFSQI